MDGEDGMAPGELKKTLETALALTAAGDLAAAAPFYARALELEPSHPLALHHLSSIHLQSGCPAEARPLLERWLADQPDSGPARELYAVALHELGEWEAALGEYDKAVRLNPRSIAWFNRGNLLAQLGRHDEAVESFRNALANDPRQPEVLTNLAESLRATGRLEQALASLDQAVAHSPGFLPAWHNRGGVLRLLGRPADAALSFRKAIGGDRRRLSSRLSLAVALAESGDLVEAEREARSAASDFPRDPAAASTLGKVLHAAGRLEEATACYRRSLALEPHSAETLSNLGVALREAGANEEAFASFRAAAEVDPEHVTALAHLAGELAEWDLYEEFRACCARIGRSESERALWEFRAETFCPTIFGSAGEIAAYRRRLDEFLEGFFERDRRFSLEELVSAAAIPSFNLPFHGWADRPVKEKFARIFERSFPGPTPNPGGGKPRIGIVITHGREPAFLRSMEGMFPDFSDAIEPVVVCSPAGRERIRGRLPDGVRFLPMPADPRAAADAVRDARFDLLYFREIGTDAVNYFLPFLRLAPVQCNTYGIQVTSGNRAVDYYISTDLVEPPEGEQHYTETLVRLETLLVHRRRLARPAHPTPRDAFGIRPHQRVYLCAQQLGKFHPDFDRALALILERDERGVVVVTEGAYPSLVGKLMDRFRRTIPAADRIRFVPQQKGNDYASLLLHADVVLDPFHFGGMNTTYDPFSLGKAVVTLPSRFHRGRYTLGCYRAMDMDDLVASSVEDYVARAVLVAAEPDLRRRLEAEILERSAVLFENRRAAVELESFFLEAVEESRGGGSGG